MAGIDKTYTNSYKEYREFRDWAEKQTITCWDGYKENLGEWVYEYKKEDFKDDNIPIMNTSTRIDIYLIQNCPFKFIIDRMKEVYSKESYKELELFDLSAKPSNEYRLNREIIVSATENTSFPLHLHPYKCRGKKRLWTVIHNGNLWYNDKTNKWVSHDSYYPAFSNYAYYKSIRAAIRQLRKQYLPKGTFTISGNYIGEEYLLKVK